ncbi:hypothetical protein GLAREA_02746 [Glarea lozoyensis ATCC 20868]|uniref:Glycosyltransferase family 31 protein n=1 Tax=Glarea lozoyensis (strain ATCC 20868 / MF5171) TaxID=1116229 RepID=S3CK11_GLAL2|nr:uncharacterized protein GLAREA_02746 [Glarea lozoyensis ATCC 20868]EPE26832.1 hypothetical protein GLAREA_02746 [Glarea lozoyensis ATCC 20868]
MGPRKPLLLVVFLTIFASVVFVARLGAQDGSRLQPHLQKVEQWIRPPKEAHLEYVSCEEHLGWLEPYSFTYPIQYVSRDIVTVSVPDSGRPSLTVMEQPLFGEFSTVDLGASQVLNSDKCLSPLALEVPRVLVRPADASNMIFGLQTTIGRLKNTVKHLARWLPNTNARLYAIVIESEEKPADDAEMAALEKEFHDQGMNVSVIHPVSPTDSFAQRYFSLGSVMYQARNGQTEWIVFIDDDTFFPSMHDLQLMLQRHNPKKPWYIGSLSEDWWAVDHYGLMGFGGAGILLSITMAETLDKYTPDCKAHLRTTAGDISVMDCIYQHSSVKLTHIPELHQVDMHGDLSGFYESGREILSLHHWKEGSAAGYKLEMEKMHLVADICDDCFLRRWQFSNEILLSNGFSITQYPQGHLTGKKPGGVLGTGVGGVVDKINLGEMENTWADEINVLHSLAPARPKMGDDIKTSYKLLDSMWIDSDPEHHMQHDTVRQVYFKEGAEGEKDTVMVLNWHAGTAPPTTSNTLG